MSSESLIFVDSMFGTVRAKGPIDRMIEHKVQSAPDWGAQPIDALMAQLSELVRVVGSMASQMTDEQQRKLAMELGFDESGR